jgi:hypothetical protein
MGSGKSRLDLNGQNFSLQIPPEKTQKSQIWNESLFLDMFADKFVDKTEHSKSKIVNTVSAFLRMQYSLQIVLALLSEYSISDNDSDAIKYGFRYILTLLDATCMQENALPAYTSDSTRFLLFLSTFISRIKALSKGDMLCIPTILTNDNDEENCILIILYKSNINTNNDFTICIVNTWESYSSHESHGNGGGLNYHPANFDYNNGRITRNICLELPNIPNSKILNTTFWYVFYLSYMRYIYV